MAREISCSVHPGVGGKGQTRTASIAMFSILQLDHLSEENSGHFCWDAMFPLWPS